jgi:hypothetical protein
MAKPTNVVQLREAAAPSVPGAPKPRSFQLFESLGFGPWLQPAGAHGGKIAPNSSLKPEMLAKTPAEKGADGLWRGRHDWTKRGPATTPELQSYQRMGANGSLRTGEIPGMPGLGFGGIDFDVDDPRIAASLIALAPRSPRRTRAGSPRAIMLYRLTGGAEKLKKIRLPFWLPSQPTTDKPHAVEFLLHGGQCIVDGTHPSGVPYEWPDGYPVASELPELDPARIDQILDAFRAFLVARGCKLDKDAPSGATAASGTRKSHDDPSWRAPSPEHVIRLLKVWKPDELAHGPFVAAMAAIFGALGPDREDFYPDVFEWAPGVRSTEDEATRKVWNSFYSTGIEVGWDWLVSIAGQGAAAAQDDFAEPLSAAERNSMPALAPTAPEPIAEISVSPFVLVDPASIEPRAWLSSGRHQSRKFVSMTAAPGGVGKSALALTEAVAFATGKNLLGEQPIAPINVLYLGGEDPLDESERRLTAICMHHQIGAEEIAGRLFMNSGRDSPIILAGEDRKGLTIFKPIVVSLMRAIRERDVALVYVDPFVAFHAVSENDNTKINAVCREWAKIADETGCAVELVHHTKKLAFGQSEVGANDARGASATLAAARSARVLNVMTKDEAAKAGIETPRSYFRVDNVKANMAPPAERSTWRRIVSVPLGNGRGAIRGDSVVVVTAWTWPDPSQEVTPDDIQTVREAIAAGEWRESTQASNWAGKAIASALRLDLSDLSAKSTVRALLRKWIDDGILKLVNRRGASRKLQTFVEVGNGGAEW